MYKLLIADDDEIICRGIAVCIDWKSHDIQVSAVCFDGQDALEHIEQDIPDIAIIDINMPFLNGIQLAQILRQRFPEIKVIMLTAYKEFEYAKKAVELHVCRYVTKPFQNQELEGAVLNAVEVLEEERIYRKEVRRNVLLIQSNYLAELLSFGNLTDKQLQACNISSSESWFGTCVISIRAVDSVAQDETRNDDIRLHGFLRELGRFFRKDGNVHPFLFNGQLGILVEYSEETETGQIKEFMESLSEGMALQNREIRWGIGKMVRGLDKIHESYEAAEADYIRYQKSQDRKLGEKESILQKALDYIDTNYMKPDLNLKDVSSAVNVSVSYLCAIFHGCRGTSYTNYLNGVRMERAKWLLENDDIKTYEVAFYVGMNSSQYFSSNFKKYTGMTPKEYRLNVRRLLHMKFEKER